MNEQFKKHILISYLTVAAVFGFLVFTGTTWLAAQFDLEAKFGHADYLIQGLSLVSALSVMGILWNWKQGNSYVEEVMSELFTKVTWPASQDTWVSTWVVIVMVIIAVICLFLVDSVFRWMLGQIWTWF